MAVMRYESALQEVGAHAAPFLSSPLSGVWYVAHTRSRNEKALACELGRFGIVHYLPLARRVTRGRASNRISRSLVPVFPGYLFFNANEEQRYLTLRTNRVASVLDVPDQRQLVAELQNLHGLLSRTQDFLVADCLQIGDWGRIIAGPLAGIEGTVTRFSSRMRLNMNVSILGQSVSIEIDADNVERVEHSPCF